MTKESKQKQPRRLTVHQAKLLTIFTGYQLVPMSIVHTEVQSRLGGDLIPVQSWSDPDFISKVLEVYREDMMKILPQMAIDELSKHEESMNE